MKSYEEAEMRAGRVFVVTVLLAMAAFCAACYYHELVYVSVAANLAAMMAWARVWWFRLKVLHQG